MSRPVHEDRKNTARRRLNFNSSDDEGKSEPPSPEDEIKTLDLSTATEVEKRQAMERWNFDFEHQVPLEGDWVWEKVEQEGVPNQHRAVVKSLGKEEGGQNDRNV